MWVLVEEILDCGGSVWVLNSGKSLRVLIE